MLKNFGLRQKRDCSFYVVKTKALIIFAVTTKLIGVFVFAYAKSRFPHNETQISVIHYEIKFANYTLYARNIMERPP